MEESKIQELLKLIEQWTRAEIMARHAPFKTMDASFSGYANLQVEIVDKIRQLVFGTDDLIDLGLKWGLLKPYKAQTKEELTKKFLKLQKQLAAMTED